MAWATATATSSSRCEVMFSVAWTMPTSPKTWTSTPVGDMRIQEVLAKMRSQDSRTAGQPTRASQPGWMQRTQVSWSQRASMAARSSSSMAR